MNSIIISLVILITLVFATLLVIARDLYSELGELREELEDVQVVLSKLRVNLKEGEQ